MDVSGLTQWALSTADFNRPFQSVNAWQWSAAATRPFGHNLINNQSKNFIKIILSLRPSLSLSIFVMTVFAAILLVMHDQIFFIATIIFRWIPQCDDLAIQRPCLKQTASFQSLESEHTRTFQCAFYALIIGRRRHLFGYCFSGFTPISISTVSTDRPIGQCDLLCSLFAYHFVLSREEVRPGLFITSLNAENDEFARLAQTSPT